MPESNWYKTAKPYWGLV